ncbi:ABC transporter ATP-binding protein [Paenibacillus sp. FSL R7-0204]|uniref:ABC transporter ATP-binding protein n=1 Tax=Paenibacillus sp. FSL R7-0204 TaxID=2921675 RepID=UPI0030F9945D
MELLKSYAEMLKLTYKSIPLWSSYTIFNSIFGVVCSFLSSVILIQVVLNGLATNKSFMEIIVPVIFIQAVVMLGGISTSLYYSKIDPVARQILHKKIVAQLIHTIMHTDTKNLDNAAYLNNFSFAINQVEKRTTGSILLISNLLSNVAGIIATVTVIGVMHVELVAIVVLTLCAAFIINTTLIKTQYQFDQDILSPNRKTKYVERTFYMKRYALELRLYPIQKILFNLYDNAVKEILHFTKKYGWKTGALQFLRAFNQEVILYWGTMSVLLFSLIHSESGTTVANIIPITIAVYSFSGYLFGLTEVITSLKEYQLYSDKLFLFLQPDKSVESRKGLPVSLNNGNTIAFENVSFKYAANDRQVLENITLRFNPGERIALAGVNGSGKSTIIKLLLGLYDHYSGEITINGESIRKHDLQQYRKQFSVVQQDFQYYTCTVAENILMDKADTSANTVAEQIRQALHEVDLNLDRTPEELLNTCITSEFSTDGLSLSKGQYQKMAIARIFVSKRNFIILDEPTSSLDPVAEYQLFNHILEHFHDKTIIIISHRLTAAKSADKIYLIDGGTVKESGTHEQLLSQEGKYSELYKLQAEKYL